MSAFPPVMDDGAQYDGLRALLPKLAQPSWVWQIGEVIRKNETLAALQAESLDKKAQRKDAKRRYKAYRRLYETVHGTA